MDSYNLLVFLYKTIVSRQYVSELFLLSYGSLSVQDTFETFVTQRTLSSHSLIVLKVAFSFHTNRKYFFFFSSM